MPVRPPFGGGDDFTYQGGSGNGSATSRRRANRPGGGRLRRREQQPAFSFCRGRLDRSPQRRGSSPLAVEMSSSARGWRPPSARSRRSQAPSRRLHRSARPAGASRRRGTPSGPLRRRSRGRAARPGAPRSGDGTAFLRVARVADEAEHVAGVDDRAVHGERRVGGEMRVVVLVAVVVAQPEPPAADVVPADREHRAVRDGEQRRAERREDVVAVMPAARHVTAQRAVRVPVRRGAVDREDVAAAVASASR